MQIHICKMSGSTLCCGQKLRTGGGAVCSLRGGASMSFRGGREGSPIRWHLRRKGSLLLPSSRNGQDKGREMGVCHTALTVCQDLC